ncbi:OB-fold domain-containing protein [Pseudomonas fluorescens]|nr:OB-fold domain-containing protein [Pseudomonas fluorescens]
MTTIRPDADFQEFLKQGQFMLQRSRSSQRCFFYPRVLEPQTGNTDLEWVQASGFGTVYSATIIRPKPPAQPYNVALVDLDEGPRMMSRIEGVPAEQVTIGLRVKARIVEEIDQFFVVFDPHHH